MYTIEQVELVHGLLVHCFEVVGIGALLIVALNVYYWRKR